MELDRLKVGAAVDEPTVSASMATALLAYSGIAVKMLVDQRLDAAAAHDVHGRVRARRSRPPARPSARGVVRDPRGRGRGARGRRAVHAAARATPSGPASAASTRSTTAPTRASAGWRRRRRSRRPATRTASTATGSTCRAGSRTDSVAPTRPEGEATCRMRDDVQQALDGKQFWSLATVNPDGSPQNTTVWVQAKDGKILVNTALGRKKPRNLDQNPHVALSWFDPENPYTRALGPGEGRRPVRGRPGRGRHRLRLRRSTSARPPIRGARRASSASRIVIEPTHISGQ